MAAVFDPLNKLNSIDKFGQNLLDILDLAKRAELDFKKKEIANKSYDFLNNLIQKRSTENPLIGYTPFLDPVITAAAAKVKPLNPDYVDFLKGLHQENLSFLDKALKPSSVTGGFVVPKLKQGGVIEYDFQPKEEKENYGNELDFYLKLYNNDLAKAYNAWKKDKIDLVKANQRGGEERYPIKTDLITKDGKVYMYGINSKGETYTKPLMVDGTQLTREDLLATKKSDKPSLFEFIDEEGKIDFEAYRGALKQYRVGFEQPKSKLTLLDNNRAYYINPDEYDKFKSEHPNAVIGKVYKVDNNKYGVPSEKIRDFLKKYPNAIEIK